MLVGSEGLWLQTPSSNTSAATAGSSPRVLGAGSEGWKPLTGSGLLLTGAFWFQPCGLNLMVTLGVLRRSRFTGELRTPPTPTGRPRPPEAESLRSGAFGGWSRPQPPCAQRAEAWRAPQGSGLPHRLHGASAGPGRGEARRGPPPAAGSPRAAAAAAGPPPPSPPRSQLRRAGRRRRGPGRQQPAPTWPRPPRGGETPANAPPAPSPAPSPSPLGGRQHVGRAAHTARRQPARLQGR